MKISRLLKIVMVIAAYSAVIACSGGGCDVCGGDSRTAATEPPASAVSAEGIWDGTGLNDREVVTLVLDTGEYFAIYSATGNSSVKAGLLQGNGKSSASVFSSSDSIDFNFEGAGATPGTLDATVEFQTSLNGTVTADNDPSNPGNFTSTFNSLYNKTPSLAAVDGTYDGQFDSEAGAEAVTAVISKTGVIAVTGSGGCIASGTINPHSSGNVYDVEITFGALPCTQPNQAVSGAGSYDPASKLLLIGLVNSNRSVGTVFSGSKGQLADVDTDGDGIFNSRDMDDDDDGIADFNDDCPLVGPNLNGSGCPGTPIKGNDLVAVDGKVWAQADLFNNLSWNDINAVCAGGVCANGGVLNGHDMTGWTWASVDDINALFNGYIGTPELGPGGSKYVEVDSLWAPAFFSSGWRADTEDSESRSTYGWTRSIASVDPDGTFAYVPVIRDCLVSCDDSGYPPGTDTARTIPSTVTSLRIDGGWFFRSP
jgi:hypothetical protein